MFTHLLKLIWNKKKQNGLLMLELFFSFIGLFVLFTFLLYPYNNYKLPNGFNPESVWMVHFNMGDQTIPTDSLQMMRESVKKELLSMEKVEAASFSGSNIPFSGNGINATFNYAGQDLFANIYSTEDSYATVMGIPILEGRWFSKTDLGAREPAVVINEGLRDKLFGKENPIGKLIGSDVSGKMKVVGIAANSKDESPYEVPRPGLYRQIDTSTIRANETLVIKVRASADAAFEGQVVKALSRSLKMNSVEIVHMDDLVEGARKKMLVVVTGFSVVAGFLLINVALGIFGVLWYNISRRRGEIGLRRAVGATGAEISRQLVYEALLMATISLLLGCFFSIQLPLLNMGDLPAKNYITAIILSVIVIYCLVIVCAVYPGRQAANIYPATALHED